MSACCRHELIDAHTLAPCHSRRRRLGAASHPTAAAAAFATLELSEALQQRRAGASARRRGAINVHVDEIGIHHAAGAQRAALFARSAAAVGRAAVAALQAA